MVIVLDVKQDILQKFMKMVEINTYNVMLKYLVALKIHMGVFISVK